MVGIDDAGKLLPMTLFLLPTLAEHKARLLLLKAAEREGNSEKEGLCVSD